MNPPFNFWKKQFFRLRSVGAIFTSGYISSPQMSLFSRFAAKSRLLTFFFFVWRACKPDKTKSRETKKADAGSKKKKHNHHEWRKIFGGFWFGSSFLQWRERFFGNKRMNSQASHFALLWSAQRSTGVVSPSLREDFTLDTRRYLAGCSPWSQGCDELYRCSHLHTSLSIHHHWCITFFPRIPFSYAFSIFEQSSNIQIYLQSGPLTMKMLKGSRQLVFWNFSVWFRRPAWRKDMACWQTRM